MASRTGDVAVVLAGGDLGEVPPGIVPHGSLVVAADSGLRHAEALGLVADLVVGDLDSVAPELLDAAVAAGATVEPHPCEKDQGDLELALRTADRMGAARIVVLGAAGGPRLDHFLANALLLGSDDFAHLTIEAVVGDAHVHVVRRRVELRGAPGSLVTLLALGGPARGVRTTGLRYPLDGDDLTPGSTRGLSNELVEHVASVSVAGGVLLAVQPFDGTLR
jgi:thiamine pyrophosphokinase